MKAKLPEPLVLSIGMIVKNEERTLERCLKSIQPLLAAVPSELIIADTGSTDRTWEIGERFADKLFHFDWVDDFSAARNATLDQARGSWFMYIDGDEWFESMEELIDFFTSNEKDAFKSAGYIQRNYMDAQGKVYQDFIPLRLFDRSDGRRFQGLVHESIRAIQPHKSFHNYVHHYGYVTEGEKDKGKSNRNIPLLLQALKQKDCRPQVYYQLAREYMNERNYGKGIQEFQNALKALGEAGLKKTTLTCSIYHDLVEFLWRLRRYDESVQAAEEYLALGMEGFSSNLDIYYYLADNLTLLGENQQAEKAFEKYLAHYHLFQQGALSELDRMGTTVDCYQPRKYMRAMLNYTKCLLDLEKPKRALEIVGTLLEEGPEQNEHTAPLYARERECVRQLRAYSMYANHYWERKEKLGFKIWIKNVEHLLFDLPEEEFLQLASAFGALEPQDDYLHLMALRQAYGEDMLNSQENLLLDMLESAPATEEYGELVFFAQVCRTSPNSFVRRVRADELSGYVVGMKRFPAFKQTVEAYYLDAPPANGMVELRWELMLLEYVLLYEGTKDSGNITQVDMQLFERYCSGSATYTNHVYAQELLQGEDVSVVPRANQFGYIMGQALAKREKRDVAGFLRTMQPAGDIYPLMIPYLWRIKEQVQEALYAEEQRQTERELTMGQIKSAILNMIEQGDTENAEQALLEYTRINPGDEELLSIRLRLRMAGYKS